MPQALLDYLAPKRFSCSASAERGAPLINYIRRHFPEKELSIADQNPVNARGCARHPALRGSLSGGDKPL